MYYPLNMCGKGLTVSPIFKDYLKGEPYIFDFSSQNPRSREYNTGNFDILQEQVFSEMRAAGAAWGIGKYLEERKNILSRFPQMIEEKRYFHAGLDITVPQDISLFAPLTGIVFQAGIDEGQGNYGGYIILRHQVRETGFFSLYGHLCTEFKVKKGDKIEAGESFATIGADLDSGGWFTHTHLQVLTERAVEENRTLQGYVTQADLEHIEAIFPSPYFLFKY